MSVQKPSIPKGTRDFGPAEVQKRRYILNTIESVFKKYGFMPIETPTMENLSSLEGKYGDEGDKLLFRILDSGDYWDNLSKDLLFFYESLIQVTDEIFKKKRLSEDDAKDPISLRIFLENNYQAICKTGNIFALLYNNSKDEDEVIQRFSAKLNEIAYELWMFYVNAHIHENTDPKDIDFHLKQFVINNFGNMFNYRFITKEVAEKGLRYDLTVPFARYVVMNRNNITFPFKRYQMQPVWRADRPQKGRYREFWQCDADVVGSDSLLNESDLIQIYLEAFERLGVKVEVRINNRKILTGLSEIFGIPEKIVPMTIALDKYDKIGMEQVSAELINLGANYNAVQSFVGLINEAKTNINKGKLVEEYFSQNEIANLGIKEIILVSNYLLRSGVDTSKITHDIALARGLSYYTGCILEVTSKEGSLKSSIGGGGRYDNLTGNFGLPNVSGVGISFGLDRIYDVMEELKLFPAELKLTSTKLLFCYLDAESQLYALACLRRCRYKGIASEIYPDDKRINKQLDYANALQIPYAVIIGENERKSGRLVLKNLVEGTQEELTIEEIIQKIR